MRFVPRAFRFSFIREPYTKKLIGNLVDITGKNRFGTLFVLLRVILQSFLNSFSWPR